MDVAALTGPWLLAPAMPLASSVFFFPLLHSEIAQQTFKASDCALWKARDGKEPGRLPWAHRLSVWTTMKSESFLRAVCF